MRVVRETLDHVGLGLFSNESVGPGVSGGPKPLEKLSELATTIRIIVGLDGQELALPKWSVDLLERIVAQPVGREVDPTRSLETPSAAAAVLRRQEYPFGLTPNPLIATPLTLEVELERLQRLRPHLRFSLRVREGGEHAVRKELSPFEAVDPCILEQRSKPDDVRNIHNGNRQTLREREEIVSLAREEEALCWGPPLAGLDPHERNIRERLSEEPRVDRFTPVDQELVEPDDFLFSSRGKQPLKNVALAKDGSPEIICQEASSVDVTLNPGDHKLAEIRGCDQTVCSAGVGDGRRQQSSVTWDVRSVFDCGHEG
jgi:hypothetical protein